MNAAETVEEVSALGSEEREYLRDLAKRDLFVLSKGILGRPDVNPSTHGGFCRFFDRPSSQLRRLGLMPRGHLKSTIATVDDSLRIVLNDPDHARVLIANEVSTLAKKFLSEIKGHWEKGTVLRALFPELVPSRFTGPGVKWSDEMASVVRGTTHKEQHWSAIGVGGTIVGAHFTNIKCDDLIGFDASRSQAEMAYTIAWNDNIESLLIDQHINRIDWIGTRWKQNDLYSHIMKRYGGRLAVFTRQAIEDGEIIFPQLHTWDEYRDIQTNTPQIWFAQYDNNPQSGEANDFPAEQLRSFQFSLDGQSVLLAPQGNGAGPKVWSLGQLDIVVLCDPNSGRPNAPDTAAIVVAGVSPADEVVVLYAWSGRPSPSQYVDKIYEVAKRWKPRAAGIEEAGQQNSKHYFEEKASKSDFYLRVEALKPKNRNKEQRIRDNLDSIIRSGRLYLLTSQTTLREQIGNFPDTVLWDEVDALAYGPELWRKPFRREDQERKQSVLKKILTRRSTLTGY